MDKWEFFQGIEGLWRWRWTSPDGRRVFNSPRAHVSRAHAVDDAKMHGYAPEATKADLEETSVNLKGLRWDE
jgi:hypothetical protein